MTPLVLGPALTPVVTDPAQARMEPDLTLLSTIAHGWAHPDRNQVLDAFRAAVQALENVDQERAEVYVDVVRAALPTAARRYLEELMRTEYRFQSDIAIRQMAEGRTEDVLIVLEARGIDVPTKARERITSCIDSKQITRWLRRAATATSVRDLFAK
jgi:hypothetical protein